MLEERLKLDVGELDVEKVEEEACLLKGIELAGRWDFITGVPVIGVCHCGVLILLNY